MFAQPLSLLDRVRNTPASVTTLDLSYNNLGNKTGAELAQAFAAIPASVTTLDLHGNSLDNKTGAELAQAFAAIPITVGDLKNHGIDMAVFESFEHPISWMAKAKRLLELDRTPEVSTYRTDALNLLLAIPPESPLYPEAAQLLWMDLYGAYVSQQTPSIMPFAADVGVVSEATTTISFSMVREYALAAAQGNILLSIVYPGINNDGFGQIDSEFEFQLCSEYIIAMKSSGKCNHEIHLTQNNLSQFKAIPLLNEEVAISPERR
jgi:hypothetical protein